MEHAKLFVKRRHLLRVWLRVPASLAILLLLLPPLHDACLGCREEDDPVRQAGHERGGQRDQRTPPVGRVEKARKAARGPERPTGQREGEDSGQSCLQAEVPGEGLGLEVGELQDREGLELDDGSDACLRIISDSNVQRLQGHVNHSH